MGALSTAKQLSAACVVLESGCLLCSSHCSSDLVFRGSGLWASPAQPKQCSERVGAVILGVGLEPEERVA